MARTKSKIIAHTVLVDKRTQRLLALPFVADIPGQALREFWNIPSNTAYTEACQIGRLWGVAFVLHAKNDPGCCTLPRIARAIATREAQLPPQSGSKGYAVGFYDAIETAIENLGTWGECYQGGLERWLEDTEARTNKLKLAIEKEEQRTRIGKRAA